MLILSEEQKLFLESLRSTIINGEEPLESDMQKALDILVPASQLGREAVKTNKRASKSEEKTKANLSDLFNMKF